MTKQKRVHRRRNAVRLRTVGAPPGIIVPVPDTEMPRLWVAAYDSEQLECKGVEDVAEAVRLRGRRRVFWLHVAGLGEAGVITSIMESFGFHPLAMEDVGHTHQQPKVESYANYVFVVMRYVDAGTVIGTRQLCAFLGGNYLVTFAETDARALVPIRRRLQDRGSLLRQRGCDFLLYAIIDAVVDEYFPLLEAYMQRLDVLEDRVTEDPPRWIVHDVHAVRAEVRDVRRQCWRQRDMVGALLRLPTELVSDQTRLFLRDCQDHAVQVVELLEVVQETCSDVRDVYLSAVSNRMNEIMMVLTIIATLFIPLSFIASVYGMNFNPAASPWNMPELNWPYGYPFALGLMGLVAAAMLGHFRRLGWIGVRRDAPGRSESPAHRPANDGDGEGNGHAA